MVVTRAHFTDGCKNSDEEGDVQQGGLLSEYVRKKELATEFDVSERTIERWVRLRLLPAPVRLGRTTLYHVPTVIQHLADQAKGKRRPTGRPGRSRVNR